MAVAYESVSTLSWISKSAGDTFSISKPTGLAVGDMMVAHISGVKDAATDFTMSDPAGWTALLAQNTSGTANRARMQVAYKVADSSDVAASQFTWTQQSSSALVSGAIYRISGASGITGAIDSDETADATPVFTNTITQTYADSLLLFLLTAVADQASGSVTGYAVTNNNPTWTERYDVYGTGTADGDGLMAGATAMRSAATATGDSTCTLTSFADKSIGAIVIVAPTTSAEANFALITQPSSTIFAPTLNFGTTASAALLTSSSTILSPTTTAEDKVWTESTKPTTTWTESIK